MKTDELCISLVINTLQYDETYIHFKITDSNKFEIVSSVIFYHSSWRTSFNCLRDVGGGNLLLKLLSKSDYSVSLVFKSCDCADHGRFWSASSCFSNQDWTFLTVCMDELSSWKTASLLWNSIWAVGCTWWPKMSTWSLAAIRPFGVVMRCKISFSTIVVHTVYFRIFHIFKNQQNALIKIQ